jgi:hypothetical protein
MILSEENIFLIVLAIIWIIGAILQDLRRREVDNIWNFSLIGIALAYRASIFIYNGNIWFFINGVLGFVTFIILGNIFYYSRLFAGGDAKLLMGLGPILPLSYNWIANFKTFGLYILLFLICGSVYVLIWAFFLVTKNWNRFKKEFLKHWKKNNKMFLGCLAAAVLWIIFVVSLGEFLLILMSFIIILFPILYVFAKAVEEACMIKALDPIKITEGDWLYHDIVISGKKIKATWDGVSKKDLNLIRAKARGKILIKQGIPFTPSFLFALIGLIFISYRFGWI